MSTTTVIRIDPDGMITELPDTDVLTAGRALFGDMTTTFTCQAIAGDHVPAAFPSFDTPIVGVCHDFAYSVTPTVNPKAWALYGRSPIAGPALITRIDHAPFDERFVELLRTDFVTDPTMIVPRMVGIAAEHGLAWPS